MLNILHEVERLLPKLLEDSSSWNTLFIDYHPPIVERVWRQWNEYRICLHRIYSCEKNEALFHQHPWPSAMKVLEGVYEMNVGYGKSAAPPPVAATILLPAGSEYEMIHPQGWHSVRPLEKVTMSLMVTGKPRDEGSPQSAKPLCPLPENTKEEILRFFQDCYKES
ncbi:MAG: hypothetical protein A3I05_04120 [Deltaproteobacteria bacterium RIFCSPLOWO2_02_FULL_44_10]|nr:MAG: hypothetical protein A3C46_03730 [Deltaproteobacteria bacterium RIFCSPHIGHO2_02_FULL_44_16]OGQ46332.1 MAG: hypothetical protein A3I05_04120 [Deltaproteobacteria bacterium RIFCSPLOWO2_02_FULL_44_10]